MIYKKKIFMPNDPDSGIEVSSVSESQGGIIMGDEYAISLYNEGSNIEAKEKVDNLSRNNDHIFDDGEALKCRAAYYVLMCKNPGENIIPVVGVKLTKNRKPLRARSLKKFGLTYGSKKGSGDQNIGGAMGDTVDGEGFSDCLVRECDEEAQGITFSPGSVTFEGIHYRKLPGKGLLSIIKTQNSEETDIEAGIQKGEIILGGDVEDACYVDNLFTEPGFVPMTAETYFDERIRGKTSLVTKFIERAISGSIGGVFQNRIKAIITGGSDFTDFVKKDMERGFYVEFEIYKSIADAISDFIFQNLVENNGDMDSISDGDDINSVVYRTNRLIKHIAQQNGIHGIPDLSIKQFTTFVAHRRKEGEALNKRVERNRLASQKFSS